MNIYSIFRGIAFRFDPELVHEYTMRGLENLPAPFSRVLKPFAHNPRFSVKVADCDWPFPVGLAAGLDKNATAFDFFARIGFGAVEVGTVTPRPQPGNPKPRLFRMPDQNGLRNRMGFNNDGAEAMEARIRRRKVTEVPLGVNLGKNKDTPEEKAWEDYKDLYERFASLADYLVINVSSPNTPGLRDLQNVERLAVIFEKLEGSRLACPCPLFLKISPDLALEDVTKIVELAKSFRLAGLVATNTTIMPEVGEGGVSGKPLADKSRQVREHVLSLTKGTGLDVIGVGGIWSGEDALSFWNAGGKALQVYTSFIYKGPKILDEIRAAAEAFMQQHSASTMEEAFDRVAKGV